MPVFLRGVRFQNNLPEIVPLHFVSKKPPFNLRGTNKQPDCELAGGTRNHSALDLETDFQTLCECWLFDG